MVNEEERRLRGPTSRFLAQLGGRGDEFACFLVWSWSFKRTYF